MVKEKEIRRNKITEEMGDFIRAHTNLTVKELSNILNVAQSKIYYYISKNNIKVKKQKTSVEKFLEKISANN